MLAKQQICRPAGAAAVGVRAPVNVAAAAPRRSARRGATVAPRAAASGAGVGQPTEAAAIAAFKAAHGDTEAACLEVLTRAARTKAVAPEIVEGALAWLEANTQQKGGVPSVDGTWRLVFSTSTGVRPWQYIPVKEDLVVDTAAGTISLESELGPFNFVIGGGVNAWRAAAGELDFQFSKVDILLFGRKVWTVTPKTKPKTYTFYYVGDAVSAARSSAGGLSLMLK